MSKKPASWCSKCRTVHKDGVCPKRKPFERKRVRGKQSGRGGRKWQRTREFIFNRDRFLCQICLSKGIYTAVELHGSNHGVCDHIIPLTQGGTDDHNNLQTICQACDKIKTSKESRHSSTPGVSKV